MLDSCAFADFFFVCLPLFVRDSAESLIAAWTSKAMALQTTCSSSSDSDCTDVSAALHLKFAAMVSILFAGACGVALPLFGRRFAVFKTDGPCFMLAKAFAAGVILATGFVHMLPDAAESLTNSCLPEFPWRQFPFSDCIAMLAALGTLVIDVMGTEYYERKHAREQGSKVDASPEEWVEAPADAQTKVVNHMHVVGIHAHAASHTHTHSHGHHSCIDGSSGDLIEHAQTQGIHEHVSSDAHDHSHGHSSHINENAGYQHKPVQISTSEDVSSHIRHVVVSQVLELGIVAHSVIIGITLGVSESPCTIRPLFAALSFHQFFEGFALGGCISEAGFKSFLTMAMAICFTLTTPLGIAVGTGVSSEFNANSPISLIIEGVFDSISAGILIYMALVDLIAADFLTKRMQCNSRLRMLSYGFLLLGAASMSAIAIWT